MTYNYRSINKKVAIKDYQPFIATTLHNYFLEFPCLFSVINAALIIFNQRFPTGYLCKFFRCKPIFDR